MRKFIKLLRSDVTLSKIMGRISQSLHPNLSYCKKCGLTWNWCVSKTVNYSEHSGTFATCDYCWDHSTLDELKGCYTETYKMQERSGGTDYKLDHTLEHLLKCVEKDYHLTHKKYER
jgi:hypothetical protein